MAVELLQEERARFHARTDEEQDRQRAARIVRELVRGEGEGFAFLRERLKKAVDVGRTIAFVRVELAERARVARQRERQRDQRTEEYLMGKRQAITDWCTARANEAQSIDAAWALELYNRAIREELTTSTLLSFWNNNLRPALRKLLDADSLGFTAGDIEKLRPRTDGVPPVPKKRRPPFKAPTRKPRPKAAKPDPRPPPSPVVTDVKGGPGIDVTPAEPEPEQPRDEPASEAEIQKATVSPKDANDAQEAFRLQLSGPWGELSLHENGSHEGEIMLRGKLPWELADRIVGAVLQEFYPSDDDE